MLKLPTTPVANIDGAVARLAQDMLETMYDAPGVGLAANQVGVQKRLFVYDIGEGPGIVINPVIESSRDEWTYEEGCLSVPGLYWPILRPKVVHMSGVTLDGDRVAIEAEELLARVFLHEVDHLDGKLLIDRLDPDQRREAMRTLRNRILDPEPR